MWFKCAGSKPCDLLWDDEYQVLIIQILQGTCQRPADQKLLSRPHQPPQASIYFAGGSKMSQVVVLQNVTLGSVSLAAFLSLFPILNDCWWPCIVLVVGSSPLVLLSEATRVGVKHKQCSTWQPLNSSLGIESVKPLESWKYGRILVRDEGTVLSMGFRILFWEVSMACFSFCKKLCEFAKKPAGQWAHKLLAPGEVDWCIHNVIHIGLQPEAPAVLEDDECTKNRDEDQV